MIASRLLPAGIAPLPELVAAIRAGRPGILIDDRPGGQGAVIVPAEALEAADVTFMALQARGLICLALTEARAEALGLRLLERSNDHAPAFAVSIEARLDISTGISAFDRAHTIRIAADPASTPADLVSPGHIFPVVTAARGVLDRPEQAEAAVDLCRLAGRLPVAAWCTVLDESGNVAGPSDLVGFGLRHGLPVGRMADLVAHRKTQERRLSRIREMPFRTRHGGGLTLTLFRDSADDMEHVALWRRGDPDWPALLRIERIDFVAGLLHREVPGSSAIDAALEAICGHAGSGALILVRQRGHEEGAPGDVAAKIAMALGLREVLGADDDPAALCGEAVSVVSGRETDGA